MMRINRRAQAAEASRLLALREGNTSLSSMAARDVAVALLGRLATASGSGDSPVALQPRVELDSVELRRGSARPAQRSDAVVRRERRRVGRPRPVRQAETPPDFLGIAPEVGDLGRIRATDLLDICRAFGEALAQLEQFALALAAEAPAPMAASGGGSGDGAQSGYPDGLTSREVEVLLLVAEGRTSKEIAAELCVAVPTVSRHLANIYAKIDARSRADATRYALANLSRELASRRADGR